MINSAYEVVCVITSLPQKIAIVNIYNTNTQTLTTDGLQEIFDQIPHPCIILTDLNAHNILWGSQSTDRRGKQVETFMNDNNLILLNTGDGTRYNSHTGELSSIDLSLCSASIAPYVNQWEPYDHLYGSDHFPIKLSYDCDIVVPGNFSLPKWNIKFANWISFSETIERNLNDYSVNKTVDEAVEHLESVIVMAATEHIGVKKLKFRKSVPWWNTDCETALRENKAAFNKLKKHNTQNNRIEFQRLRARARLIIKKSKRDSWTNYVSTINSETPLTQIWDKVRRIKGIDKQKTITSLKTENNIVSNSKDIVETLSTYFQEVSSDNNYSEEFLRIKNQMENRNVDNPENPEDPINSPITNNELEDALSTCKKTAPGPDRIPYTFLQHLPETAKSYLLNLFNQIWTNHQFPQRWSESLILPVLKPNKAKNEPTSYRPISLTCTMGKLLEKIINKRLTCVLEANNLLSSSQYGFRKYHSTTDCIVTLESDIHQAFANKQDVLATFFDIQKAYDRTWRYLILNKLQEWGLTGNIFSYIHNFLQNRSIRVKANETLSEKRTLYNGIPQGSTISVTLFLIAINDVFKHVNCPVRTIMYADDLLIYVSGKNHQQMKYLIQNAICQLENWSKSSGFAFSAEKTKCILFSKKRRRLTPTLTLCGNHLQFTECMRYLGVYFDHKLSWKTHIEHLKVSCNRSICLMRCIANHQWGAESNILLQLYRALIRSKTDYGLIAYSTASKRLLKTVQAIHNNALRIALGAYRTSPTESLYSLANEIPLPLRIKQLTLTYATSVSATPFKANYTNIFSHRFQAMYAPLPYVQLPFHERLRRTLHEIDFEFPNISPLKFNHCPWKNKPIEINLTLSKYNKSFTHPAIIKAEFNHIREHFNNSQFIYTDASKMDHQVGAALITPEGPRLYPMNSDSSIFTAEMYALLQATTFACRNFNHHYVIASDSLSSLLSCRKLYPDNPLAQSIVNELSSHRIQENHPTFIYVPSHTGIPGNEQADHAARQAALLEDQSVQVHIHTDIKSRLKHKILEIHNNEWQQSHNKLREIQQDNRNPLPFPKTRRAQVIITRLRIGHTKITHEHLIKKTDPPICDICQETVTVKHLLLKCSKYTDERRNLDLPKSISELLGESRTNLEKVLNFLDTTGLNRIV